MDDASRRLAQLAQILSDACPSGEGSAPDPVDYRYRVRLQRIERLTVQLGDPAARDVDQVDAVAMRLLLDEYASLVADLRAVAREDAKTLEHCAAALRRDRRLVNEQLERQEKRFASIGPSDRPPASRNPGI